MPGLVQVDHSILLLIMRHLQYRVKPRPEVELSMILQQKKASAGWKLWTLNRAVLLRVVWAPVFRQLHNANKFDHRYGIQNPVILRVNKVWPRRNLQETRKLLPQDVNLYFKWSWQSWTQTGNTGWSIGTERVNRYPGQDKAQESHTITASDLTRDRQWHSDPLWRRLSGSSSSCTIFHCGVCERTALGQERRRRRLVYDRD